MAADKNRQSNEASPVEISLDSAKQTLGTEFVCNICHNVVWEPVECKSCSVLNCSKCIKDQLNYSKKCPSCRSVYKMGNINRLLKNQLEKMTFNCTKCEKFYQYGHADKHLREDHGLAKKCVNDCSMSVCNKETMRNHLADHCPKTLFDCLNCQSKVKRCEAMHHDCHRFKMKQEIAALKEQIESQEIKLISGETKLKV